MVAHNSLQAHCRGPVYHHLSLYLLCVEGIKRSDLDVSVAISGVWSRLIVATGYHNTPGTVLQV